jgi:L-ascorbate metabolism protein UlaG (beta-lactamase superfamily)
MTGNRYYHGPTSDHFDGVRFFNPGLPTTDRGVSDLLRWRLTGKRSSWPASVERSQVVPESRVDGGPTVTMVGHATVLIQVAGRNVLVDPVWSERASPMQWAGPRRVSAPGIAFDRLPPIDVVLLTHNHYDHLDATTLQRVWERHRPRIVAPLGNDTVIHHTAPSIVVETGDWGQVIELGAGLVVHIHPANHWSARGMSDRRMALWAGFVLETPTSRIYVAGDTGYGDGRIFRELRRSDSPIDLAILPIGAYEPRWFMKDQHCDPDEAVQIMIDCGARQAVGVHWGTFQLTDESRLAPKERLLAALGQRGMPAESFVALEAGDVWPPQPPA